MMDTLEKVKKSKQYKKKNAVSLTDDEYNNLFNSVINYTSNNEHEDYLPSYQEQNDSDKENMDPRENGKPKKTVQTKNVKMSKNSGAEKKIVPKFSAPVKGKSANQPQQTKFVPPHLKTTSSGNTTNDASQKKKNPISPAQNNSEKKGKTQEYKKLNDIFKPTKIISKDTQEKNKKQITPNLNQKVSNTVSKHSIKKKVVDTKESALKGKALEQKSHDSKTKKSEARGKSRETVYVRKEMSSSDDSSSETSESSQESEESHGHNSVSTTCLSQGRDGNLYLSLSGSATPMLLSQPPVEYTQRQRMEWLRSRRDVGVWVQCCKPQCSKWRYLENVKDPIDVPEYWICEMNDDPKYNNCDKAEKGPTISEQVDLIDNKYTAGSVVWARLTGFPWWPAIVDDDPDVEAYYWLNGFSDIPTYYHVAFFDKEEVTRAWITPENLKRFTEKDVICRPLTEETLVQVEYYFSLRSFILLSRGTEANFTEVKQMSTIIFQLLQFK